MWTDHPLADIFTPNDLELLAEGKALAERVLVDPRVAHFLAGSDYESEPWLPPIREWFLQAASHGPEVATHYRRRLRLAVRSIEDFFQPIGELRAAYFLERQQGFRLTHIPVDPQGARRTPEFEIGLGDVTIIVEVKTIGILPGTEAAGFIEGVPTRSGAIRDDIRHAVDQLDRAKCNLLLIIDQERVPILGHDVLDAMHGTEHLSIPYIDGSAGEPSVKRARDGRLGPKLNTRVGVIGVLRMSCVEPHVYFVHNIYAARPIPPELLDPWPQLVCGTPRNSDGEYWR